MSESEIDKKMQGLVILKLVAKIVIIATIAAIYIISEIYQHDIEGFVFDIAVLIAVLVPILIYFAFSRFNQLELEKLRETLTKTADTPRSALAEFEHHFTYNDYQLYKEGRYGELISRIRKREQTAWRVSIVVGAILLTIGLIYLGVGFIGSELPINSVSGRGLLFILIGTLFMWDTYYDTQETEKLKLHEQDV